MNDLLDKEDVEKAKRFMELRELRKKFRKKIENGETIELD